MDDIISISNLNDLIMLIGKEENQELKMIM